MTNRDGLLLLVGVLAIVAGVAMVADRDPAVPVVPIVDPLPWEDVAPDPQRIVGAYVVLIEESRKRTPYISSVVREFAMRSAADGDLNYRTYDDDLDGARVFVDAMESARVGVPALIIVSPDKQLLDTSPLPATMDDVDDHIFTITGVRPVAG